MGDDGAACGVRVEKTRLETNKSGSVVAVGTGEYESYPVQLVLKSIGYKPLPVEGVAFDARGGVIPNAAGRVLKGGERGHEVAGFQLGSVNSWDAGHSGGRSVLVLVQPLVYATLVLVTSSGLVSDAP